MRVFSGLAEMESSPFYGARSVVTIGNFDGVHPGHQQLLRRTQQRARELGVRSVVLTFEPHPLSVLRPDLKLRRLFDPADRQEQMARHGVDILVIEPFSRNFSQLSPEQFLSDMILRPFQPVAIVVGYDFSFGANRTGSIEFLKAQSELLGFEFEVVRPVSVQLGSERTVISSTRIRQALEQGDAVAAAALLGRPYELRGIVKKGAGRGRAIGIPTANLETTIEPALKPGVYAAWARVRNLRYQALVNIGRNPTFVDTEVLQVEAHLPEFIGGAQNGDLYGEMVALEFVERLRDERKFASAAELVAQIRQDILIGQQRLKGN